MNPDDPNALLEPVGDEVSQSIDDLKQKLAEIESLRTRVEMHLEDAQAIADQINEEGSGLDSIFNSAKDLEAQISSLKLAAETDLQSIASSLSAIQSHVPEMEAAYNSFTEINNQINSEETGMIASLNNARALEEQLASLRNDADGHLQSITNSLSAVQAHIAEMEAAYNSFTEINNQISSEETGLEAILTQSKSLQSDIEATKETAETIFIEIGKLKDTAAEHTSEIGKLAEAANSTTEKIKQNHQSSEELKTKINHILNVSARTAHANYFDARKKTLARTSLAWLVGFFLMFAITMVLGSLYIAPLARIISAGNSQAINKITIEVFLVRLGLVTPALAVAIYCLDQFGHERRLYEQYAFKAIGMLSVESSIELLTRALENTSLTDDKDNQIISFAVSTLESIYRDPVEISKRSLLFRGGNKLLAVSAGISQSVGEIKNDVEQIKENTLKE